MNHTEEIKNLIVANKENLAFLIGNGIHNYLSSTHKKYPCKTWRKLLYDLWCLFANKPYPSFFECGCDNEISNIEFFNLLEMEYISNVISTPKKPLASLLKCNSDAHLLKNRPTIPIEDLACKKKDESLFTKNHSQFKIFSNMHKEIIKYAKDELNLDYSNDMDTINQLIYILSNDGVRCSVLEPIKKCIAKEMATYKSHPIITKIIKNMINMGTPLLTTNYDTVFSDSIGIDCRNVNSFTGSTKDCWTTYYGEPLENPLSGFGIWHIHGVHTSHKSISISATDYMRNVHKAMSLFPKNALSITPLDQNIWDGYYSWLNIIFNKDIFVFGIGLNSDETFLRWLLLKRAEYIMLHRKKLKSWYVTTGNNISCSQKYFLESIGFEIIIIKDWNVIYEKIWN